MRVRLTGEKEGKGRREGGKKRRREGRSSKGRRHLHLVESRKREGKRKEGEKRKRKKGLFYET